jgi:hypothetical protein
MAQHEIFFPGRSPTVLPLDNLDVGPADADRNGLDEYRPVADIWLGYLLQPRRPLFLRFYNNSFDMITSVKFTPAMVIRPPI